MTNTAAPASIGSVKAALKHVLLGPEYAAKLAELERAFGDGVPLPPPSAVFTTNKEQLPSYPAFEMLGDGSDPDIESSTEDYQHRIDIVVWMCGDDEEVLTAQVERYVLALRRTLRSGLLTPFVANAPIRCGHEDYSPSGRGKKTPQAFLKAGSLELLVETLED